MQVDSTTLSDLEIFRSADGGPGLFAAIDQTQTSAGNKAFRRRLKNPLTDIGRIREVQEAVRFFVRNADALRFDEAAIAVVQRYLRSNIDGGRSPAAVPSAIEGLWLSLRYRVTCTKS